MRKITHTLRRSIAVAIVAGVGLASPAVTNAAPSTVQRERASVVVRTNNGAFVRVTGDNTNGTVKFQYGWSSGSDVSDHGIGYWLGIYDVTNSRYVWPVAPMKIDTGDIGPLPDQLFQNVAPIALPNSVYKVVFFVRDEYDDPSTEYFDETHNIAEIDGVPFTINYMGG